MPDELEANPKATEWVAQVKKGRGHRWARVDPGTEPRTLAACRASIEQKRRRYPDCTLQYRVYNVRTREAVEV